MPVDQTTAQWLQDEARFTSSTNSTTASRWGDTAIESTLISPIAGASSATDAATEAARQQAFLNDPLVEDRLTIKGNYRHLEGKVVTAAGKFLGYDAGVDVFVIGAEEDRARGITFLSVLRRLT